MKGSNKKIIFVIAFLMLLIGCIGSPRATKEEEDTAKKFVKDQKNSVIYIYRGWAQATRTFRLYIDDNLVGESNNNSFFKIVSPPGMHTLTLTNVRNFALGTLSINTDADKVYYIELKGSPIFGSKLTLTLIEDQEEAMRTIRQFSLLKTGTTAMAK